MVITFNKNSDIAKLREELSKRTPQKFSVHHKKFDTKKFCGTLKFDEDGLKIQQKLRDEWD
ncbi:MAG: hypothetical protein ACRYFA_04295 [Janthinobacterium lividum]